VLAGAGLVWQERRTAAPLIDPPVLAASGIAPLLAGALCAYLVLFGPLVLIPQVLTCHGGSVVRAGLTLAALPAGFGLAAVAAERILPAWWPDRRRSTVGGVLASACAAALAFPAPVAVTVACLGLLGAGLGIYIPANNTAIMAAVPPQQGAAAGGMVNMARGLGTACGVAVVTLALHASSRLGHAQNGQAAAMAVLAAAALLATWAGHRAGAGTAVPRSPAAGSLRRRADDHPCPALKHREPGRTRRGRRAGRGHRPAAPRAAPRRPGGQPWQLPGRRPAGTALRGGRTPRRPPGPAGHAAAHAA
jgi:MFS family permease